MENLKKEVHSKTQILMDEQILIFSGKQLENENHLSHYCISNNATLFLVIRIYGGTEQMKQPEAPPVDRKPDPSMPQSREACMMPCGHIVSPDDLIDDIYEVWFGTKIKVVCRVCNANWDVDTIRQYSGATDEEIALLQEGLSRNYCSSDPKISQCPGCNSFCQRRDESDKCTLCTYCFNRKGKCFYFCWDCKKEWKGSPLNKTCGNDKCTNRKKQ